MREFTVNLQPIEYYAQWVPYLMTVLWIIGLLVARSVAKPICVKNGRLNNTESICFAIIVITAPIWIIALLIKFAVVCMVKIATIGLKN